MDTRLTRRTLLKAAVGTMGVTVLTACAPKTSTPAAVQPTTAPTSVAAEPTVVPPTAVPEQVTLQYYSWPGMAYEDSERSELLDPFEQANPNIKVELSLFPYDEYWDKMLTLAAANNLPDYFGMCPLRYGDWVPMKVLMDLDPFVDKELDKTKFYTEIWDQLRAIFPSDPKLYGLPFRAVIEAIAYNKNAFERAGVAVPSNKDWTWDDFGQIAKQLTLKDAAGKVSQYGASITTSHNWFDAALNCYGGEVLDKMLRKCLLDSERNIETIQMFVDWILKDHLSPNPSELAAMPQPFQTGKLAMTQMLSCQVQEWKKIQEFDWDVWWMPRGPAGLFLYGAPDQVSIWAKTKHPDECLKLLKFANSEQRGIVSVEAGSIPTIKAKAQSEDWLKAGNLDNQRIILDEVPYMKGADFGRGWAEWRSMVMNNELTPAFLGEKPVADAVKSAAQAIQAVLDKVYAG